MFHDQSDWYRLEESAWKDRTITKRGRRASHFFSSKCIEASRYLPLVHLTPLNPARQVHDRSLATLQMAPFAQVHRSEIEQVDTRLLIQSSRTTVLQPDTTSLNNKINNNNNNNNKKEQVQKQ